MNDEYIRKEDAIRLAEQGQVQGFPWQFQMLIRLPHTNVVQVVRCRDCKHFWKYRCMDSMPIEMCDLSQTFYDPDTDFCSLAERRKE